MKKQAVIYIIIILSAVLSLAGCRNGGRADAGGKIILPSETAERLYPPGDTAAVPRGDRPAIIIYYDARGCTSCRLKELHSWRPAINRIRRESPDVDIIAVFHTEKDNTELSEAIMKAAFDVPVICDPDSEFERLNKIPEDPLMQTFLVDRNNKVVLSGTPIYNGKMLDAYINAILRLTK